MRKLILAGGALLLLYGCSNPTAPQLQPAKTIKANDSDCEARTGYFVRAGRSYEDSACTVEIPL